jgi:hypothetical protein
MKPIFSPLLILCGFSLIAVLACNFPTANAPQPEITLTAQTILTQTAVRVSTASAGNEALFATQTAAVPPTPTVFEVATALPPTATTLPPTGQGQPTQTSIANNTLKVGVEVVVRSTGAGLRLREVPGLNGKLIIELRAETPLKITGGPQATDGVLWWEVNVLGTSSAAGKSGWVSEFADNRQTIEVKP